MRMGWKGPRVLVAAVLAVAMSVGVAGPSSASEPHTDADAQRIGAQAIPIGGPLPAPNATGNCSLAVLQGFPAPPSCTLFSGLLQAPRGATVLTQASVRTGPATGPMRFVVLRAYRSQAQVPGQPAAGAICCTAVIQSQVFTPAPNRLNTIPVQLPMLNTVTLIDGEPIEVVDYLAISILDQQSTLPLVGSNQGTLLSAFLPAFPPIPDAQMLPGTFPVPAIPTWGGVTCPATAKPQVVGATQSQPSPCQGLPGPGGPGGPGGSGGFVGLTPARLLDTRGGGVRVEAGSVVRVPVAGVAGVPGDAVAAVLNVTAVDAQGPGFLTVFPCGEDVPEASNVNYAPGQVVPNAVVATLGADGAVCVFSLADAHVVVDVNGAFR